MPGARRDTGDTAGAYVEGDVTAAGDFIGRDKVEGVGIAVGAGSRVTFYGDVHYYPIKLRAPLRRAFDPLIEDHTLLFGGRLSTMDRLAEFVRDANGGYLVITGPAGFGKTSLVASLVKNTPDAFAYHFFSRLYGRSSLGEGFFLQDVVEQIAQWHGYSDPLPAEQHLNELRALYHRFLSEPLNRMQVLVVDGLDEVGDWSLKPYLSRQLPARMHVILTVRDVGQDWAQDYGLPMHQTKHLPLDGLSRAGIAEVLSQAGSAAVGLAEDPSALDHITRIAAYESDAALGADPFYVRFLAEDAADGRITLENVDAQPYGLTSYLDAWWDEIVAAAGESPIRDLFGTLTAALGPISRDDLEAVNQTLVDDWATDQFDRVVNRVRRLVLSTAQGYSLMHPRLRQYMRTKVNTPSYHQRLLAYCSNWQRNQSAYALEYYVQHLAQAGRREDLYELISQPWMDARLEHSRSYGPFADDVTLAIAAARSEKPPNLVEEARCSIIRATLNSLAAGVPDLLRVLAQTGETDVALAQAALIPGKNERFRAYFNIGQSLVIDQQAIVGREVLLQALDMVPSLYPVFGPDTKGTYDALALTFAYLQRRDDVIGLLSSLESSHGLDWRTLGSVAKALAILGERDGLRQALRIAEQAEWRSAEALSMVTPALAELGMIDELREALHFTETAFQGYDRARALTDIASAFSMAGKRDEAVAIADRALSLVRSDDSLRSRPSLYLLMGIGKVLAGAGKPDEAMFLTEEALQATWQSPSMWTSRDSCEIAEIVLRSNPEESRRILRQVIERAMATERVTDKASDLMAAARSLAKTADKDTLQLALQAAASIGDEEWRASTLSQVAHSFLVIEEREQARAIARLALSPRNSLEDRRDKVNALLGMAQALKLVGATGRAAEVAQGALRPAEGMLSQEYWKADALSDIANALSQLGARHGVKAVVEVAENIITTGAKCRVLSRITEILVRDGEKNLALQLAKKAVAAAQDIDYDTGKVSGLALAAHALILSGDSDRAIALANTALLLTEGMEASVSRTDALREIVPVLVETKQVDELHRALAAVQGLDDPTKACDELCVIARAFHRMGSAGLARQVAASIESMANRIPPQVMTSEEGIIVKDEGWRESKLEELVSLLIELDDLLGAQRVADTLSDNYHKCEAISAIAGAVSKSGRHEEALLIIDRAFAIAVAMPTDRSLGEESRAWALGAVMNALVRMKEYDRGFSIASAMAGQSNSIQESVDILLESAEFAEAQRFARTIPVPTRLHTLNEIIQALVEAGQATEAHEVINEAFALWRTVFADTYLGTQSEVFLELKAGALSVALRDQGKTLWAIYKAILSIDDWWTRQ